jgi:hexosaminidase
MKYTREMPIGATWAAIVEVKDAYAWDPATLMEGVGESDIAGIEAALWTESCQTLRDIEFFMFPRLLGVAETAWSPVSGRNWDEYRARLGTHGPRLQAQDVNFYRSPQVPWA